MIAMKRTGPIVGAVLLAASLAACSSPSDDAKIACPDAGQGESAMANMATAVLNDTMTVDDQAAALADAAGHFSTAAEVSPAGAAKSDLTQMATATGRWRVDVLAGDDTSTETDAASYRSALGSLNTDLTC